MKSLIAVLALASALGVGYWKMQNPDGGIDEAKSQARGLMHRLGSGIEAVRSGNAGSRSSADRVAGTAQLDTRIAELEQSLRSEQSSLEERLAAIESAPAAQTGSSTTDGNMAERLTGIDETLATAASLASDTESRMVLLEESVAALNQSGANQETDTGSRDKLEEQLSSLQERMDAQAAESAATIEALKTQLEQQVNQQLSDQNATAKEDLETQLSDIRGQAQSLAGSIDQQVKQVAGQLDRQDDTDKNLSLLDEKVAALTARINTLGSANASGTDANAEDSNALASVTAQVDQRLAAIEDRITAATSADTRSTMDALQAKLDTANERISELETKLASTLDNNNTTLSESLSSVGGEIETVEAAVSGLQTDYEKIQTNVQSLQVGLGELKSTVESYAIEDLQNDVQTKLTNLENQVKNSPANDIASITSLLEQSRDRIKTLEQRVTDLPASSDESQNAKKVQSALEKQIAALEARLTASRPATDDKLSSTLSSVQKEVDALKNRKYLTAEDLKRSTSGKSIEYKIYFDKSQIGISDEAAKVLDSFIAQESNRATSISIFGTTDRSGSDEYNQQLAKRRANRVRSYLIQRGYDFSKIGAVDGIGEDLAAAELPDGQEDANQRSVIIYAYQP